MPTVGAFTELLGRLTGGQALTYGLPVGVTPVGERLRLVTREAWVKNGRPAGQLPRTNDTFAWPEGLGVMVLDYDPPKDGRDPLGRLALCEALTTVVPGLAAADRVWWASASSHITDTRSGEDLTGLRGQRLYLLVADARDIPRAGAALVEPRISHVEIKGQELNPQNHPNPAIQGTTVVDL